MDKVFDTKKTYIGFDGEEYVDMCIPVVDVSEMYGNSVETINKDEQGRLDNFVWKNVAKNLDMIDMVMYANHIFNPFAVKEGDILNIPADSDSFYKPTDEPSLPDGSKHSKNSKGEKSMTYAEKVADLARRGLGVK